LDPIKLYAFVIIMIVTIIIMIMVLSFKYILVGYYFIALEFLLNYSHTDA